MKTSSLCSKRGAQFLSYFLLSEAPRFSQCLVALNVSLIARNEPLSHSVPSLPLDLAAHSLGKEFALSSWLGFLTSRLQDLGWVPQSDSMVFWDRAYLLHYLSLHVYNSSERPVLSRASASDQHACRCTASRIDRNCQTCYNIVQISLRNRG